MARCRELTTRRNERIRKQFEQLRNERTAKGIRKYTLEYCLSEIAEQWYLRPKTVEGIVYSTEVEDDSTKY
jgi:hypothetical protein